MTAVGNETVQVYIEDFGRGIGIFAVPARIINHPIDPMLNSGICEIPREQAERWQAAEEAMEAAQAEMRPILEARRRQMLDALAGFAGYQAANKSERRGGGRR